MTTTGPNVGGTFASDATLGVVAMSNPTNAVASDNSYVTSVLTLAQASNYLKVTNFGFNIPADATITGITVAVERSGNTLSATVDNSVKLVKGGSISGNDKASGTLWGTSDSVATYGSSTDLWGLTLTPADVNLSTFGMVISASATLAGTAQIDYVTITVDWTGSNRAVGETRHISVGTGMARNDFAS